jgi:predicted phage replisome organizer
MSDTKKYYFLKLKDNFFQTEQMNILEGMPNGIYYSNLLLKLYLISLKHDGALKLNDEIYYDEKMLVTILKLDKKIVSKGIETLISLGFIERLEDGKMFMSDIQSFIGRSNNEAERKRVYRNKIKQEKLKKKQDDDTMVGQVPQECPIETGAIDEMILDKRPPENRDKSLELIDKSLELRNIEDRERETKYKITSLSVGLVKDFEERTGATGYLNLAAVKKAVELHGAENVKRAMDKALEKNKPSMTYINGILKNWAVEGYPEEVENNGYGSTGKNNGAGQFAGFKPKEPRTLSEEEREALESELI